MISLRQQFIDILEKYNETEIKHLKNKGKTSIVNSNRLYQIYIAVKDGKEYIDFITVNVYYNYKDDNYDIVEFRSTFGKFENHIIDYEKFLNFNMSSNNYKLLLLDKQKTHIVNPTKELLSIFLGGFAFGIIANLILYML